MRRRIAWSRNIILHKLRRKVRKEVNDQNCKIICYNTDNMIAEKRNLKYN